MSALKVGDLVQIVIAGAHITYIRDQIVQLRTAGGHTYVFDLPTPGVTVGLMTSGVCAGPPYRSTTGGAARDGAAAGSVSCGEAGHGPGTPDDWPEAMS